MDHSSDELEHRFQQSAFLRTTTTCIAAATTAAAFTATRSAAAAITASIAATPTAESTRLAWELLELRLRDG